MQPYICAGINVTTALSNPQKEFVKVSGCLLSWGLYGDGLYGNGLDDNGVN